MNAWNIPRDIIMIGDVIMIGLSSIVIPSSKPPSRLKFVHWGCHHSIHPLKLELPGNHPWIPVSSELKVATGETVLNNGALINMFEKRVRFMHEFKIWTILRIFFYDISKHQRYQSN